MYYEDQTRFNYMREITNVLIIYEDQTSLIYLTVMRQFIGCKIDSKDRICTKGNLPFTDTIQILEETDLSWEQSCDFATALKKVKRGTDLSDILGYAFSDTDIKHLAELHKANKYRSKIESLLEDCNFHTECGDFAAHDYDKYLKY